MPLSGFKSTTTILHAVTVGSKAIVLGKRRHANGSRTSEDYMSDGWPWSRPNDLTRPKTEPSEATTISIQTSDWRDLMPLYLGERSQPAHGLCGVVTLVHTLTLLKPGDNVGCRQSAQDQQNDRSHAQQRERRQLRNTRISWNSSSLGSCALV